jgi:NADPH:quinone reductase-like Zn-dependent oxidoreductase
MRPSNEVEPPQAAISQQLSRSIFGLRPGVDAAALSRISSIRSCSISARGPGFWVYGEKRAALVHSLSEPWRSKMQVAGIREIGAAIELIDLPEPRPLASDELLIEVRAAGVGNWDEVVRVGGWDVGRRAPMALGVEAAGTVVAVGQAVADWAAGDEVMSHPLPLRDQGSWAPLLIAPAALVARRPKSVSWSAAAAFPVPALTAEQVLSEALHLEHGQLLLVHGAGGVTGGLLVALAALRGAQVIATAGPSSRERVRALGAQCVLDYHNEGWPEEVIEIADGAGVAAAANAAHGGAALAIRTVADGGQLATITSDPPGDQRDIVISTVYVRSDGGQLRKLARLLAEGRLALPVASAHRLADAAQALGLAVTGQAGGAVVLAP